MVLIMRNFSRILTFFIAAIVFSCESMPIINCSDCLDSEPLKAEVKVNLDDRVYTNATLVIYEGDIEDNIVFGTFSYNDRHDITITVPLNKRYTFAATYKYQFVNGTYTAVDTAFPRVRYDESQCENPCYYVYDNKVDLRIKYQ